MFRHGIEIGLVGGSGNLVRLGQLFFCKKFLVIGGVGCENSNEGFRIFRNEIDPVAPIFHFPEKNSHALDGIQAQSISYIGVLGRVVVKNNSHLFISVFFSPESGPFSGLMDHVDQTLHDGSIPDFPIGEYFLAGHRHAMDGAIEFGEGDGNGNIHRRHAFEGLGPVPVFCHQGISEQYRDALAFQKRDGQGPTGGKGKLHEVNDGIYCWNSAVREIAGIYFRQRWHAHFRNGKAVAEDGNHIHFFLFDFPYQGILVCQVLPQPFIPVKEEADSGSSRMDVALLVVFQGEVGGMVIGIINATPGKRLWFFRFFCIS